MAIDKPYSVTLPPRRQLPQEEAELEREIAEQQEIDVKAARNKQRAEDPIGDVFGGKLCKRNYSFWFIRYNGFPVRVTHYYPDKNVAVDVFQTIGPAEKIEIAFKRKSFKNEGIRYGALDWSVGDAAELLPQISKVSIWPFSKK